MATNLPGKAAQYCFISVRNASYARISLLEFCADNTSSAASAMSALLVFSNVSILPLAAAIPSVTCFRIKFNSIARALRLLSLSSSIRSESRCAAFEQIAASLFSIISATARKLSQSESVSLSNLVR
ncbi:hypothetical protein D3C77_647100 [compost metagenome]